MHTPWHTHRQPVLSPVFQVVSPAIPEGRRSTAEGGARGPGETEQAMRIQEGGTEGEADRQGDKECEVHLQRCKDSLPICSTRLHTLKVHM